MHKLLVFCEFRLNLLVCTCWSQTPNCLHVYMAESLRYSPETLLISYTSWQNKKFKKYFSKKYITTFSSVQLLNHVQLFVTPWIAARQASLSITNSQSSLKLMPIESVMPSSHLILCCPLLLLPPIPPSIKVFSNESTLPMRWPK